MNKYYSSLIKDSSGDIVLFESHESLVLFHNNVKIFEVIILDDSLIKYDFIFPYTNINNVEVIGEL